MRKTRVIAFGYCRCGCGGKTNIAKRTRSQWGHIKGQPIPYIFGHHSKINRPVVIPTPARSDIRRGECYCGCKGRTEIATKNDPQRGILRGEPLYFIRFHHRRSSALEYIEKDNGYKTPCWEWQRAIDKKTGYGCATDDDAKARSAHAVYYERESGPVPDGMHLDHLCRTRRCVRPDHLEPVSQQINVQRGSRSKLSQDSVRKIRELRNGGMLYREIAERLGVGISTVQNAAKGDSWGNVEGIAPCVRQRASG